MSLTGVSIASRLSGRSEKDLTALALRGDLSAWHDSNGHAYFDLAELQGLAEPEPATTDRLFELTGSEKDPRQGSVWQSWKWDYANGQAEQLGTPEVWQAVADEALERAWRDLSTGAYAERLSATLRSRPRPTLQVQRRAVEAAQRAIQPPLVASVGKRPRGRPRSAAWSLDADRLAEMHEARVSYTDQAEALGVSYATLWRRCKQEALAPKEEAS